MEEKHIVALEIGSSRIRAALGRIDDGTLTVVSVDQENLVDGVRHGMIRNVEKVAAAIGRLLDKINARVAPRYVTGVYVAVGGRSVCAFESRVERQLPEEMEITEGLVKELKLEALAKAPADRDVLAVTPKLFTLDRIATLHPVGEFGRSLTACFNLICCQNKLQKNIERAICEKLELTINDYVIRQTAEADFVISPDEKRLGCMFVDFGAETTAVSIYRQGAMQYLATIPMGSRLITRDLMWLNNLEEGAESLKIRGGNAKPQGADAVDKSSGVDFTEINRYVSARATEIILNIKEQLRMADCTTQELAAGIIIVGGGARLAGFNERLQQLTGMKVRSGMPNVPIRISDSRISPDQMIDVIAVLSDVAHGHSLECLSRMPEPEPEVTLEEPVFEPDPKREAKHGKRRGFFISIHEKMARFLADPEEEEENDELRDDD